MKLIIFLALAACLLTFSSLAQTLPPAAPSEPVTDDDAGTKVQDPYRNLENLAAPTVQQRQTGSLAPEPASVGPGRLFSPAEQAWLVAYVGQDADATLAELNAAWQAGSGRSVGQTSIWNVAHEHGLHRKKVSTPPRAIRNRCTKRGRRMCKRSARSPTRSVEVV